MNGDRPGKPPKPPLKAPKGHSLELQNFSSRVTRQQANEKKAAVGGSKGTCRTCCRGQGNTGRVIEEAR